MLMPENDFLASAL